MANEKKVAREPSFLLALVPIVAMIGFMLYCFLGHSESGYHDAHLPLVMSIVVACIVGHFCGHDFKDMLAGMIERLSASMEAVLILCTVGFLVASFMASGAIPSLIVYGLDLLTPKLFLPIGCILCAIVGMSCGSSWTTTATIGLAFLGIGAGLGIPAPITAGMIISGAYVGDKFSPLSDTTNLAAAVAETGLFDHVTAMVSSTGPTLVIALILYTIMGLNIDASAYDPTVAQSIQDAFRGAFVISPVLLIPIIVVIVMCILRVPGLVGIAISVATATIFMIIFQSTDIYGSRALGDIFNTLHYGIGVETGNEVADSILGKAGGMDGTMWTINLILLALAYGGALERCGCVERLFGGLKHKIHSVGSLILATLLTSIFCDAGRNMLSRTLEDAGTLWAVMFPWTGCGAYQTGVLGMSPLVFFPYAFVNLLNPVYAYVTALFGRNIFWADGSYTNVFGKTKAGKPAGAPEEAHAKALANLEARRAAGKAPKINA